MKFIAPRPHVRSAALLAATLLAVAGCASDKTRRIDPNADTNLSRRFNDSDARIVAETMTVDLMSRPWIDRYTPTPKRPKPTIVVGTIRNKTDQIIDAEFFSDPIQERLLNDGRAEILAARDVRGDLRVERSDTEMADEELLSEIRNRNQREHFADFVILGTVSQDREFSNDRKQDFVSYQVSLKMIDIVTNKLVWTKSAKVKKERY